MNDPVDVAIDGFTDGSKLAQVQFKSNIAGFESVVVKASETAKDAFNREIRAIVKHNGRETIKVGVSLKNEEVSKSLVLHVHAMSNFKQKFELKRDLKVDDDRLQTTSDVAINCQGSLLDLSLKHHVVVNLAAYSINHSLSVLGHEHVIAETQFDLDTVAEFSLKRKVRCRRSCHPEDNYVSDLLSYRSRLMPSFAFRTLARLLWK